MNKNLPLSRLPELDGLRAMAILLVLVSHNLSHAPWPWLRWFTEKGWVGVDLFFVLSGFLIGGILLDQRGATNYYRVFYLRRFLRIVPLYAVLVVPGLILILTGMQSHLSGHSLAGQPAASLWLCALFLQNFSPLLQLPLPAYLSPTWSVAVEEQFYLLLPPLVRKISAGTLLKILIAAIVVAPLLRGLILWLFSGSRNDETIPLLCYYLLPCRWDSLLLGVLCAIAYRNAGFCAWFEARLRPLQTGWMIFAACTAALVLATNYHLDSAMASAGYTVVDAFFAATLLLAVMNRAGRLNHFLSRPFLRPIATISYGLYLLQSPMMAVTESVFRKFNIHPEKISWPETGIALVSLAGTFVAAAVSWRFFESRMIRLGHEHRYQKG
jgi:peptidoglycan/LPS O-acetylase OafA/YrhL